MKYAPITEENFEDSWKYSCKKYICAKRAYIARCLVVPISQFLFFLCFFTLTGGIYYRKYYYKFPVFFMGFPTLSKFSEYFFHIFSKYFSGVNQPILTISVSVIGISVVAAVILWLIYCVIYRPTPPALNPSKKLQSESLYMVSKEICYYNSLHCKKSQNFFHLFLTYLTLGSTLIFLLYCLKRPEVSQLLRGGFLETRLYILLDLLSLIFLYPLLNLPLCLVLKVLSTCRVSKNFHLEAEQYYRRHLVFKDIQPDAVSSPEDRETPEADE